jgi:hypothetical protein
MNSVWLIISFTVLALFGAVTLLPTLHKTTQTQISVWPVSFWSIETLRIFGKMPLVFTLISANILSSWVWGSAVSWLLITFIFGLLLLPLSDYGFDSFDTHRLSNSWGYKIIHGLFLLASLSILIKIVIGLIMVFPEIGAAALLFLTLMAFNRNTNKMSLTLLILGLICGAIISANISLTVGGEIWLFELLLSSFVLVCLFSLSPNLASKTTLGILNGLGALIVVLTLIAAGLLHSGEFSALSTPSEPALPLICLALLLPGLLPGIDRSGRSKGNFSTISSAITSSHLLVYITGMVIIIAIISMSASFVNSFSVPPISSPSEELMNTVHIGDLYSASFAPEKIILSTIEQMLSALPIDEAFTHASKYVIILSLILGIVQLAIKQLETILGIFKPRTSANKPANFITPWLLGGMIVAAVMFTPDLSLWLACSCSFAVLIVQEFCNRSLRLSDASPATKVYLSLSLILIVSLAMQLLYLTVNFGLQKQFSVSGVVLLLLLLFMLQLIPKGRNLVSKLKKTQSSALEKLKSP